MSLTDLSDALLREMDTALDRARRGLTDQGAGYTGRFTHAPVDKYGAPIVPLRWPVNPPGRLA